MALRDWGNYMYVQNSIDDFNLPQEAIQIYILVDSQSATVYEE